MAVAMPLAVLSSRSLTIYDGPPKYSLVAYFENEAPTCSFVVFSPKGTYMAYDLNNRLQVVETETWCAIREIGGGQLPVKKVLFSHQDTYITIWYRDKQTHIQIYDLRTKQIVKELTQKINSLWEPQWSSDEKLLVLQEHNHIIVYQTNYQEPYVKIDHFKPTSYSLCPYDTSGALICFQKGTKGQPSLGKLFKYPEFGVEQVLCEKSFFQADELHVQWSKISNYYLLHASTNMDATNKSYYGKQDLYCGQVNRNSEIRLVTTSTLKKGPIHTAVWSPIRAEFCVVYGHIPANVTIFNTNCDPVYNVGEGTWNNAYFNPQGNFLLLGGFGNFNGQITIYDLNNRQKPISTLEASGTTCLQWAPDGIHFVTGTTSPRLRVDNGWKVWHCTGALLRDEKSTVDVYDIVWKPVSNTEQYPAPVVEHLTKVVGIINQQATASKEIYRPPTLRNRPKVIGLPDPIEKPSKSKKKTQGTKNLRYGFHKPTPAVTGRVENTEKDLEKKIKNLRKKLDDIANLKVQQSAGKQLEKNQLQKIANEVDIVKKLEELQLQGEI